MFKNLISELRQLSSGGRIAVPVAPDARGYLDRECPADSCKFVFKVRDSDWDAPRDRGAAFCPRCGHTAPADQWWTTEQVEDARRQAMLAIRSRVDAALVKDARAFNGRSQRGLVRISLKVSGVNPHPYEVVPIAAADVLEQSLTCSECQAGYAVVGAAFFCPCCGHNSVERMFDGALEKTRAKVGSIETIRDAVRAARDVDAADTVCRSILESCVQDCVVALQQLAERLYRVPAGASDPKMNAFQSLTTGNSLWKAAVGSGYDDWLSASELADLQRLFQQRHLLAHRDGLVDAKYVQKSGDSTYTIGQRIVVKAADVLRMVELVEKLGAAIRRAASTPA